ncbi:uncharacterized protein AMSG_03664 [Thecamonas trahens ATCC 50062]|uniref:Uncharacterized protein n=1 Tax=Thecamonas trahens ATCC 50062 TaxID=461836 RepID=A0A0L0D4R2_THETB|nr:hypothetical protein AMSG_03664 [Thecamonas trahens ATCC 50062]KNC47235.1 hypothetical protein AMSG_03664 [Thecamonas trahens ATCC 50062]|eukprot:XP_013759578.1 hypothetical protein AMSG_03664 [Thecamonas trahens ATCC 50062]
MGRRRARKRGKRGPVSEQGRKEQQSVAVGTNEVHTKSPSAAVVDEAALLRAYACAKERPLEACRDHILDTLTACYSHGTGGGGDGGPGESPMGVAPLPLPRPPLLAATAPPDGRSVFYGPGSSVPVAPYAFTWIHADTAETCVGDGSVWMAAGADDVVPLAVSAGRVVDAVLDQGVSRVRYKAFRASIDGTVHESRAAAKFHVWTQHRGSVESAVRAFVLANAATHGGARHSGSPAHALSALLAGLFAPHLVYPELMTAATSSESTGTAPRVPRPRTTATLSTLEAAWAGDQALALVQNVLRAECDVGGVFERFLSEAERVAAARALCSSEDESTRRAREGTILAEAQSIKAEAEQAAEALREAQMSPEQRAWYRFKNRLEPLQTSMVTESLVEELIDEIATSLVTNMATKQLKACAVAAAERERKERIARRAEELIREREAAEAAEAAQREHYREMTRLVAGEAVENLEEAVVTHELTRMLRKMVASHNEAAKRERLRVEHEQAREREQEREQAREHERQRQRAQVDQSRREEEKAASQRSLLPELSPLAPHVGVAQGGGPGGARRRLALGSDMVSGRQPAFQDSQLAMLRQQQAEVQAQLSQALVSPLSGLAPLPMPGASLWASTPAGDPWSSGTTGSAPLNPPGFSSASGAAPAVVDNFLDIDVEEYGFLASATVIVTGVPLAGRSGSAMQSLFPSSRIAYMRDGKLKAVFPAELDGTGMVEFFSIADVDMAVARSGTLFAGATVLVRRAPPPRAKAVAVAPAALAAPILPPSLAPDWSLGGFGLGATFGSTDGLSAGAGDGHALGAANFPLFGVPAPESAPVARPRNPFLT